MRVIIAGGRDFGNRVLLDGRVDEEWRHRCYAQLGVTLEQLRMHEQAHTFLSGTAAGADELGEMWARHWGHAVDRYPADWNKEGRRAGFLRNRKMAQNADVLVAFWDGQSRGTRHMIDVALEHGLTVHVYRYEPKASADEETF